ncbi:MAG TPA: SRPBCC family protein [Kofleriaceae bacterium]|nr:SRPBCC family protein [Kofleriaceae bacterium]
MTNVFGAEFRRVEDREHLGEPAVVVVAVRTYDTTVDDLWDAVTTPERLARWFTPVEGDLKLGGRYQLTGNASGTIERCDPPEALNVTWEFAGAKSWVHLRLTPDGDRAKLTLEHIAHRDGAGAEHFKQFGPGAVGIGWDLSLHGLGWHLADPEAPRDQAAIDAWSASTEGKTFVRESGEAWNAADVASGENAGVARERSERTIAAYTGG